MDEDADPDGGGEAAPARGRLLGHGVIVSGRALDAEVELLVGRRIFLLVARRLVRDEEARRVPVRRSLRQFLRGVLAASPRPHEVQPQRFLEASPDNL